MTVMIDSFFGIHPYVIRSGLWAKMKPGEKDLYIYLMERSEYFCTRQLRAKDCEIRKSVELSPRTACNARKKLQERGLIQYVAGLGNVYTYIICDPRTGKPYPADPKTPMVMPKQSRGKTRAEPAKALLPSQQAPPQSETLSQSHGIAIKF